MWVYTLDLELSDFCEKTRKAYACPMLILQGRKEAMNEKFLFL